MTTPRKRPVPKKLKPAHPDLIPGLERNIDESYSLALPSLDDMHQHPTYQLVLHEMLEKKVPA